MTLTTEIAETAEKTANLSWLAATTMTAVPGTTRTGTRRIWARNPSTPAPGSPERR
jgi:hypothetical protein